ncbi:MAG: DUF3108 domain-containing protein [Betaproteobacteria bacterium]|nr:DUF3108 domain-containing protein [Betaproteobacteria bacterium]
MKHLESIAITPARPWIVAMLPRLKKNAVRFAGVRAATITVALFFAGATHAVPPQKLNVQYEMSRNGTVMVEVSETLVHDGKTYRIDSDARGKGLFALSNRGNLKRESKGTIEPGGLRPLEFRDQRGDRRPEFARFDWSKREVVEERDGRNETTPIKGPTQDRLSFLWSFAFVPPKGREIVIDVADGRGVDRFRYSISGPEKLKTAAGEIDAVKLVKQREPGDDRGTEVWLSVRHHYAPVRILVVEKDGTRLDQIVTRVLAE